MKKLYSLPVAFCCFLIIVSGCKTEERDTAPEISKPFISLTAPGLTIADNVINVSVTKDSTITIDYSISAPGEIQRLVKTLNGVEENISEATGEKEFSGQIMVDIPFEDNTIALELEVVDQQGQVATETVSVVVEAIDVQEETLDYLFFEDFEGELKDGSVLSHGAEVVSNLPQSGEQCVRVNLMNSATDPFVAEPSSRQTYEYEGSVLVSNESPVTTVEWYFRFDDANWDGELFTEKSGPAEVDLKGGYFGLAGNKVNGFYTGFRGGSSGSIRFADNRGRGDDGWENSDWAVPGRIAFYLNTGETWGAGTGWHKFTIKVDYSHTDYNQVKLFIDDILAKQPSYAADGIIRVPKTWGLEHFSTSYTGNGNTNLSTDRTEVACGLQFDNIKISVGEDF